MTEELHEFPDAGSPANPEDASSFISDKNRKFTIVGMGGSAGSLESIETFLATLPPDSGIAFVLVQHLAPDFPSILPEILQRCTRMPVQSIADNMAVEPNRIYVLPEGKELAILNGRLLLLEPVKPRGLRMPIDSFLQSLAEDWGEKAACIIFSGMGADGELGTRFIKEGVGLVIVQDPDTARYDSMPRSAIRSGFSDFVLAPEQMADKLLTYVNYSDQVKPRQQLPDRKLAGALQKIFMLLRTRTSHDFSLYKKNTLFRRFERRMHTRQISDMDEYVRLLQENPKEIDELFKELLIGVTKFFRDSPAFEILEKKLIPELLKKKSRKDPFRVWVAGCSTGEEAYSIAIIIRECLEALRLSFTVKIQIYATDLDPEAIRRARAGLYMENIAGDVSPERLERWFIKKDDQFQVSQEIRETVVFAEHNIIKDACFIKLDMLCCRNLLIYLTQELQRKLLPVFHYTLNPGGILFLGPSETIGNYEDLFTAVDAKWKLFRRRESASSLTRMIEFPSQPTNLPKVVFPKAIEKIRDGSKLLPLPDLIRRVLLEKHTPPAVVITSKGDILYINGRTGKYMEPAPGQAHMNIFDMAREGLPYELRNAVIQANTRRERIVIEEVNVKTNGNYQLVRLTVEPLQEPEELKDLLLVVFQDLPKIRKARRAPATAGSSEKDSIIQELEKEVKLTREHLQRTVEEMETSLEELKSTNEELQSTNEELQSTNEESNTAKEEMQALNEELMTVNMEFRAKTEELTEVNNDMTNLLNSSEVATIFLGNNLQIKRFTPKSTQIVNLIQSDVGRPITHISSNLAYENLEADVRGVLERLVPKEIEVQAKNGQWYMMRIVPYRTLDNFIDGTVITFNEITRLKQMEHELKTTLTLTQSIINSVRNPLLVLDTEYRIVLESRAFCETFGFTNVRLKGQRLYALNNGLFDIPRLREQLSAVLFNTENEPEVFDAEIYFPESGARKLRFSARRLVQPDHQPTMILLDIAEVES